MFHSGVLFYPKVALRSNLRLKSSPRTALCARAMQSITGPGAAMGGDCMEHLIPAWPAKEPVDICRPGSPTCSTRLEQKCPQILGTPGQLLAPGKSQCPKAALLEKAAPTTAIQGSSSPCSQDTSAWAEFSLHPEKSHHSCKIQANVHHLTFPADLLW